MNARLIEIYQAPQGEGPYLGLPMLFVRFETCAFRCSYCDTPDSFKKFSHFKWEKQPGLAEFSQETNPISVLDFQKLLQNHPCPWLSLTGGEPLHQADFLAESLPALKGEKKILLETAGTLPKDLEKIIHMIDVVSMDIKLSSVTGMRSYLKEHLDFIKVVGNQELYLKVVVSQETDEEEWRQTLETLAPLCQETLWILQPLTPRLDGALPISVKKLAHLKAMAESYLKQVQVIPQAHPQWGGL
ncbi:MAG: 7-carboxy-7-deazaguanine synthase QueE [Deltaproteobacteria bacterium]|nr:7-carboxy-7-deazaguanine synthase QueE [Deltaproteobacteria bacterium]